MPNARKIIEKREERKKIILELQKERKSKIICYVTADRNQLGAVMGSDTIPLFFDHLSAIKKSEFIDIFIYTRGGYTLTPNRLVYLFREFCNKLGVMIPFRCHSAGTTLALGANEIIMGPMAELGPVDPSVANDFNPTIEEKDKDKKKREPIAISVEDVTNYFQLIRDKLSDDPLVLSESVKSLTEKIHPLALGNVHRQYLLIRTMSKRLLLLHMKGKEEEDKVDKIVDFLSQKLYFHGYEIPRYEAKEIVGLNVVYPSPQIEKLMWELYLNYKEALLLGEEINIDAELGPTVNNGNIDVDSAIIESENMLHSFVYNTSVVRKKPGKKEFDVTINGETGWKKL
jgi:hypothetical protein